MFLKIKEKIFKQKKVLSVLWKHIGKYQKEIIKLGFVGLLIAVFSASLPRLFGLLLDSLADLSATSFLFGKDWPTWFVWLGGWFLAQVLFYLLSWFSDLRIRRLRIEIELYYQARGFTKLLFLPLSFHKNEKMGEIKDQIGKTSWQMSSLVSDVFADLLPKIVTALLGFFLVYTISPLFAIVILLGVAIYVFILFKLVGKTGFLLDKGHDSWVESYGDAVELIDNIATVKSMATEQKEVEKVTDKYLKSTKYFWDRLNAIWSSVNFSQNIIILMAQVIIISLSVKLMLDGSITIGELVAVNAYAGLMFTPFVKLGRSWQILQNAVVSLMKSEEKVFSLPDEVYHPHGAFCPTRLDGRVQFKNVYFSYGENSEVLKNVSFVVEAGETVALVGKSGVGKSTTLELISAYYFPTKGEVLIDDVSTNKFNLTSLRSQIAVVPQETILFNDTVMANIKYGRPDATDEEAILASKQAHCHEFILKMPDGYAQMVGERGFKLSVGQKQRISIARAILMDRPILILDEPTSALDADTEKYLEKSLENLTKDKTTFIVAHRLSTARKADKILVYEDGKIAEAGKHDELLEREGGIYARLHKYQSQ